MNILHVLTSRRRLGNFGEEAAARFLKRNRYKILERNYVGKRGEIDIIASKKKAMVFVEVKKRKSIEDAAYSIKESQQKRIWKAAENFIKNNSEYQDCDVRFDAFLMNSIFSFKHIPDAWRIWE